jgi:hypothetical protein
MFYNHPQFGPMHSLSTDQCNQNSYMNMFRYTPTFYQSIHNLENKAE